ncbi:MAG: ABC transporter permease [Firmicutes bacterium]|nr:ABC transporter permease [Bacillota bacterium]MBQ4410215.1 ABC transporter permease [Bacillota bacterium]MBR0051130.1 ABC transporter permease [Bacillota bacterium]MBR0517983.1 ABC transporter permease [Bacillota bacterium]
MNNKDILQLCFGNLLRRRTRTILSVIGVVIGTTAIIVMLSLGLGLSQGFQEQLESYGNLHMIEVYNWGGGGSSGQSKLDDRTITKMEKIDGATVVTPQVSQYVVITGDHKRAEAQVIGIKMEMLEAMNLQVEKGRMLNGSDKNGLLMGKAVAASFYDPRRQEGRDWGNMEPNVDPLAKFTITNDWNAGSNREGQDMGETLLLNIDAQGIGMLTNTDDEYAYNIYTTIEFAQKIKTEWEKAQNGGRPSGNSGNQSEYNEVMVYVEDLNKVSTVSETIRNDYGFSTYSLNDMVKEMQKTTNMIEAVLGGIGGISLLVAAIGIANTMIMSVYERTREISVMKVIGSSLKDIRKMFLLEAGMIGFGGGLIGIALSYGISFVMNRFLSGVIAGAIGGMGSKVSVIPWWLTLAALAFATFIGVISGYSPAQRAMNMSVLEGLKNE